MPAGRSRRAGSAPIGRSSRASAGFTLIEVLVVVFIIGIVLAFVSLSINPSGAGDRLDTQSRRLEALTRTAADDAVLYGREIGLDIARDGYRFLRLGDDGWQAVEGDTPLRERELDEDIQLVLIDRDDDSPLTGENEQADDDEAPRPEAVFLSSGEIVPFELELYSSSVDHRYRLSGEANGDMALERIDEPR